MNPEKKIKAELLTKRLQFDCHPELYAEVERVCALLSCSKRRFLEMAVLSALDKSEQIFMETFHDAHGQEFTTVMRRRGRVMAMLTLNGLVQNVYTQPASTDRRNRRSAARVSTCADPL